jgi:hypothetical protein
MEIIIMELIIMEIIIMEITELIINHANDRQLLASCGADGFVRFWQIEKTQVSGGGKF